MRQGWMPLALCAALVFSSLAAPLGGEAIAAGKSGRTAASSTKKSRNTLRQFSGVVTAMDGEKLTVAKGGKKPESRTFTRHTEMKTTGDLEKDARVTVYYREDGGRSVAHKVVVRLDSNGSKSRG